jgi:hypothetical protein
MSVNVCVCVFVRACTCTCSLSYQASISLTLFYWGKKLCCVCRMQKRVIWIIRDHGNRDSCRKSFKEQTILAFISQYIFSLFEFVINNRGQFLVNPEIHSINMRHGSNLHLHLAKLQYLSEGRSLLTY